MDSDRRTDDELVQEFQSGSERAFNEIVLRHRRRIFQVAMGIVGNAEDADDIAQEVFIKSYKSLGEFRGDSALSTWLYRITFNLSLNHIRSRKLRSFVSLDKIAAVLPGGESPSRRVESVELNEIVKRAVAELPAKQRTVFLLRYFQKLSHAEIAEIMDREVGTIKANYFQAVRKLRLKLGPYLSEKDDHEK